MDVTPGVIVPSGYSSMEELLKDLQRRDQEAGFTPFPTNLSHSDVVETFLQHHGIKGQKWGIRHDRAPGVSARTNRSARRHAQEFARAKQFFGEGAGTRRKLIKSIVESKSKQDPAFKKAFDFHLARQDLGSHAEAAKKERRRKDIRKSTKQTAGAVARNVTGEFGTKAAFATLAIGGAAYLNSPAGRRNLSKGMSFLTNAHESFLRKQGAKQVAHLLRNSV